MFERRTSSQRRCQKKMGRTRELNLLGRKWQKRDSKEKGFSLTALFLCVFGHGCLTSKPSTKSKQFFIRKMSKHWPMLCHHDCCAFNQNQAVCFSATPLRHNPVLQRKTVRGRAALKKKLSLFKNIIIFSLCLMRKQKRGCKNNAQCYITYTHTNCMESTLNE